MQDIGHTGLNNLLAAYEDKGAKAVCTFGFSQGPGHEPILFQGITDVSWKAKYGGGGGWQGNSFSLLIAFCCRESWITDLMGGVLFRARLYPQEDRHTLAGMPFSSTTDRRKCDKAVIPYDKITY